MMRPMVRQRDREIAIGRTASMLHFFFIAHSDPAYPVAVFGTGVRGARLMPQEASKSVVCTSQCETYDKFVLVRRKGPKKILRLWPHTVKIRHCTGVKFLAKQFS
ncbi:hypothetical protein AVEN_272164-1 [Araneus ventricosus]|uniref:Uncharacterized protein n=1 Tax=Araneus ventricosus TaxID=182803 RepID=A0A4Y2Q7D1_ARAVE|nr:hypothetical protein AVEN_272164-1 [Araneus ventricosus]